MILQVSGGPNGFNPVVLLNIPKTHLAVLDPEKKSLNGLFSLLNMESPKVQGRLAIGQVRKPSRELKNC